MKVTIKLKKACKIAKQRIEDRYGNISTFKVSYCKHISRKKCSCFTSSKNNMDYIKFKVIKHKYYINID